MNEIDSTLNRMGFVGERNVKIREDEGDQRKVSSIPRANPGRDRQGHDALATKIFEVLMGQEFVDFHNGEFEDFVTGEEGALSEGEIIDKIKELFQL